MCVHDVGISVTIQRHTSLVLMKFWQAFHKVLRIFIKEREPEQNKKCMYVAVLAGRLAFPVSPTVI